MKPERTTGSKIESRRARARYMAQSMQLEEADVPGVVRLGVFATAFLAMSAVAWAAVTPVEELAKTEGQIIPSGRNHLVQHLEGGMVSAILVDNGVHVEAGQVLVRLVAGRADSDLQQVNVRRAALRLELERLQALDEGRDPVFGADAARYPTLSAQQHSLFEAERSSRRSRLAVVAARITQQRAELRRQTQRGQALKRQLDLLSERHAMVQSLHTRGGTPRAELLALGAQVAEVEADYHQVNGSIGVTGSAIAQADREREEIQEGLRQKTRESIARSSAELAEIEHDVSRLVERSERLAVKAPVAGIVKGLQVNTVNQVVQPGGLLLEIVPVSDRMVVESRISPRDIGHVSVGDGAHVAVDSFDVSKFGSIPGTVRRISASTYLDERNSPYYRVQIELEQNQVGGGAEPGSSGTPLIPGMTVKANIITGSKSVLDYVLRPVYRGFQNAFHER